MRVPKMWKGAKVRLIAAGTVPFFAFAVYVVFRTDPGRDLSIRFAGYSSSATGAPTARFLISNAAPRLLFVSKTGIVQLKHSGEWNDLPTTNTGVLPLLPNETFVVSVLKPTNGEAWRIFMTCGRPRTSLMWRRLGKAYQEQPFQFEPLSYVLLSPVLRQRVIYSEEVTNDNFAEK